MPRKYLSHIDTRIDKPDLSKFDKALFILHDQLNLDCFPDWVQKEKPLLIFLESGGKGREIPHHKKKAVFVVSAMRHFAIECFEAGFPVLYHSTNGHFDDGLGKLLEHFKGEFTYMTPSEWDTRERLQKLQHPDQKADVKEIPNTFFLADAEKWKEKIEPGYRMEYFYREMRKQTGYLMDGDEPEGGEWNYDDKNRKALPEGYEIPEYPEFDPDEITREVIEMIDETFPDSFGNSDHFRYAVNRKQALELLDHFIEKRLADFGPYEDAMASGKHKLFHSQLSVYMNSGLLHPDEVCERAVNAFKTNKKIPLQSVEGFIRQIIGWREFIRIYYEALMPDIREANHFGFTEKLPSMYWTGSTQMKCMAESLHPVIKDGYAHHIQRLMVLSNFSNLTETDPRELNRWFWFAFADAYEWVELPNVLGMSTYADGGILASKPYVSSGNYINKMGNYCKTCRYSVNKKTGDDACPFNYLYWNFVDNQRETFNESGRANFMVSMYDKKSNSNKKSIKESSIKFLKSLDRS
jgi:deoxyribodipyrimidine photolyase-related protein